MGTPRGGTLTSSEKCCIWVLMVCGVLPFQYNASKNRFVQCRLHCWGNAVGTALCILLGPWAYFGTVNMVSHPQSQLNYYMIVVQFVFMYIVILYSRIKTLLHREKLCQLLNSLLALREQALQQQGSADGTIGQGLTRRLIFKLIVFDVGMMVISASFFRTLLGAEKSLLFSLMGFCNLLQVSSMNVAVNLLLLVLYNGVNIYTLINARCNEQMRGWTKAPKEIVRLYLMHTDTSLVVQSIVEFVSIPILFLSIWYFFIIVFSVFYTYTSLVQDLQAGSKDALRNLVNPIAFFISEFGQVYFMVSGSVMYSGHARQIIPFLSVYTGDSVMDEPGDQAIELLTIEYLSRDYAVRIKGLFTIDNTMLFGIVASTTSYMIILVQYYLQE